MKTFELFKRVIEHGQYDLKAMLEKIEKGWVEGSLSDEERDDLKSLSQNHADVFYSIRIDEKLKELDERITALENKKSEEEQPGSTVYPEYVAGKWYYKDDTVSFEGKNYICIAPDGQVCVWSPTEYPTYWKEVN